MSLKNIDIDKAVKKSQRTAVKKEKKKRKSNNTSQNKNIDQIRELGKEITELKRQKSMETDAKKKQDIQEKIDMKQERYNELKKQGRRDKRYRK